MFHCPVRATSSTYDEPQGKATRRVPGPDVVPGANTVTVGAMFSRLLALLVAVVAFVAPACTSGDDVSTALTSTTEAPADDADTTTTTEAPEAEPADDGDAVGKPIFDVPADAPVELEIEDLVAGTGDAAQAGDYLTMHYVGVRQTDGGQFDASWDRGSTFGFTLGAGRVIQGWDQGIVGMQEGGRRLLSIPSDLAYGAQSPSPDIPADSDLVFVVDLINVASPPDVQNADAPVTELEVEVISEGTGDEIGPGMILEVHYVLMAQETGEEFDSSWTAGAPIPYQIAADPAEGVLPGWDEALVGRRVGDHLRIVMPPELGLGERAADVVGADGTLVSEVTIISKQ